MVLISFHKSENKQYKAKSYIKKVKYKHSKLLIIICADIFSLTF